MVNSECRRLISVAGNEKCSGRSDDQWHRIAGVLFRKFGGFILFGDSRGRFFDSLSDFSCWDISMIS
jgi:hypothetical protein